MTPLCYPIPSKISPKQPVTRVTWTTKVLHPVIDCNPRVIYEALLYLSEWKCLINDAEDALLSQTLEKTRVEVNCLLLCFLLCQGLLTDTPFFVTESARLPAAVQHLGAGSVWNVSRGWKKNHPAPVTQDTSLMGILPWWLNGGGLLNVIGFFQVFLPWPVHVSGWWQLKYFLFSSLFGEDSQVD